MAVLSDHKIRLAAQIEAMKAIVRETIVIRTAVHPTAADAALAPPGLLGQLGLLEQPAPQDPQVPQVPMAQWLHSRAFNYS